MENNTSIPPRLLPSLQPPGDGIKVRLRLPNRQARSRYTMLPERCAIKTVGNMKDAATQVQDDVSGKTVNPLQKFMRRLSFGFAQPQEIPSTPKNQQYSNFRMWQRQRFSSRGKWQLNERDRSPLTAKKDTNRLVTDTNTSAKDSSSEESWQPAPEKEICPQDIKTIVKERYSNLHRWIKRRSLFSRDPNTESDDPPTKLVAWRKYSPGNTPLHTLKTEDKTPVPPRLRQNYKTRTLKFSDDSRRWSVKRNTELQACIFAAGYDRLSTKPETHRSPRTDGEQRSHDSKQSPNRCKIASDVNDEYVFQRRVRNSLVRPKCMSMNYDRKRFNRKTGPVSQPITGYFNRSDSMEFTGTCLSQANTESIISTDDYDSQSSISLLSLQSCNLSMYNDQSSDTSSILFRPDELPVSRSSKCNSHDSDVNKWVSGKASLTDLDGNTSEITGDESEQCQSGINTKERLKLLRKASTLTKRQLCELAGITIFNCNPAIGIRYLQENGIIDTAEESIAEFIFASNGLCRKEIGKYFGKLTNLGIIRHFLRLIDMKDLPVDEALRAVFSYFHPSGESQKISCIVEIFQEVYCEQNRTTVNNLFRRMETIEIIAYSVMMLQTDLHNPNLRQRMSENEFVKNNRGIDGGENVSEQLLRDIYRRIANSEFKNLPDLQFNMRLLDMRICGQLKTLNFMAHHRRFVGWVHCDEVRNIGNRIHARAKHHWRCLFVFNDILIITKAVGWGSVRALYSTPKRESTKTLVQNDDSVSTNTKIGNFSTEPMQTGSYQIYGIIPLAKAEVLMFESQSKPFNAYVSFPSAQGLIDLLYLILQNLTIKM